MASKDDKDTEKPKRNIEEHEVVTVDSRTGTYQQKLAATGNTPIVDLVTVGPSLAMQQAADAHREEVVKAVLENDKKSGEEAAKQFQKSSKERAERFAKAQSKKVEAVKVTVKNPLSTALEVGVNGMVIHIPAGTSDVYAPPGVDEQGLRRAIAKRQQFGITIEEEKPKGSKASSAKGDSELDNEGIDYEPTDEEIDAFTKNGALPLPTGFTQPFREPGQNGTKTDAELEDQKREWARTELKRTAAVRGQGAEAGARRSGAARRIAEEK